MTASFVDKGLDFPHLKLYNVCNNVKERNCYEADRAFLKGWAFAFL